MTTTNAAFDWPVDGGEMGSRIRDHDWATTSLGAIEGWPQSLKSSVDLVLGSPMAMILLWGRDLIQLYNEAYGVVAADKHPDALGQRTRDCWPEAWDFAAPVYDAVFRGEARSFRDQKLRLKRNGAVENAWFDLAYSPLRDEAGQVAGVLVTVIETTNKIRYADALKQSEQRLRVAQEVAAVGTFEWDIVNDVNLWSPEIERLYGLPEGGFDGTYEGWRRFVHPDDVEQAEGRIQEALDSGEFTGEWRVVRPDGKILWVQARAIVEKDARGRPLRMIGANFDITDRHEAEEAIRASERRLRDAAAELQHRTRNLMGVVRSLVDRTYQECASFEGFKGRFRDRLAALARTQDLLSRLVEGERLTIGALIRDELKSARDRPDVEVAISGPEEVTLRSAIVQILALTLHELASDARERGIFNGDGAGLRVTWSVDESGGDGARLRLAWEEYGARPGPAAERASRQPYARELVERALPYQARAETRYEMHADGVTCAIMMPIERDRSGERDA